MRKLRLSFAVCACLALTTLAPAATRVAADAASPWLPGPNAVGDDTFTGFIDAPAAGATVVPSATLVVRGWIVDRTQPANVTVGVGGSGVSSLQVYLDGPRSGGTFLGNGTLGMKNREATGFGERFLQSGWQIDVHPSDFTVDKHELFIYATSAFW